MCNKNGPRIPSSDEVLIRQVNPAWLDDGEPSSQSFYPWRDIDEDCMSVDRGSLTTAADAFVLFTSPRPQGFEQPSAGAWGLTVAEIEADGVSAWEDPVAATAETPANAAHAVVEFAPLTKKQQKSIGRKLKAKAIARGRLHPP